MINLDKLKIALFDFDDTLCVHSDHCRPEDKDAVIGKIINGSYFWQDCEPNALMGAFMHMCMDKGITLGLISATRSYQQMTAKVKWVTEKYGVKLTNFCVGNSDVKINMMTSIAKAYELSNDNILIVDDRYKIITDAAEMGFQSASPIEVINYVLSHQVDEV